MGTCITAITHVPSSPRSLMMKKVSSPHGIVKKTSARSSKAEEVMEFSGDPDTRITLIQSLIPIALMAHCRPKCKPCAGLVMPARGTGQRIGAGAASKARCTLSIRKRRRGCPACATRRPGAKCRLKHTSSFSSLLIWTNAVPPGPERHGRKALRRQRGAGAPCLRSVLLFGVPKVRCGLGPEAGRVPGARSVRSGSGSPVHRRQDAFFQEVGVSACGS